MATTMQGSTPAPNLLSLPCEVRDMIFTHLLARANAISVVCASVPSSNVTAPISDWAEEFCPLARSTVRGRSTWNSPRDGIFHESEPQMTYEAHPDCCGRLNLEIMLVSRQVHQEACEIFYGQNTFRFVDSFRIPTACLFFEDRSQKTLAMCRSVELALMESNTHGEDRDEFPPYSSESQEKHRLRFAYHHYSRLCTILSSPSMQLRYLGVWVEICSTSPAPHVSPNQRVTVADWLLHENKAAVVIPSWLEPLLSINNLDTIILVYSSRGLELRKQALMGRVMRQRMLTTQGLRQPYVNVAKFQVRLVPNDFEDEESPLQSGDECEVVYNIDTGEAEVCECTYRNEGFRMFGDIQDDSTPPYDTCDTALLFRDLMDSVSVMEIYV